MFKNTSFWSKIGPKLPNKIHRLNRWPADNNRPINRPLFDRLIGRLIGIGRTLINIFTSNKVRFFRFQLELVTLVYETQNVANSVLAFLILMLK